MSDFPRLASAIQARARELGYDQEGLIDASEASRSTVQRLWAATALHRPNEKTTSKLEVALQWEPGSISTILDGGAPTLRRRVDPPPPASHESALDDLPWEVRVALGMGDLLGYDVYTMDVDGEPMQMIQIAVTNTQAIDSLSKQLKRFGQVKGFVRRQESDPNGTDSDSVDE